MSEEREQGAVRPESEMMRRGWDPQRGLGSLKTPLFQTSTFVFESSDHAKRLFDVVYGGEEFDPGEEPGYIYTRLDHPNLSIVEQRLALWDAAESGLLFSSGTSAIFTTLLELLEPGDLILHSSPLYGGTNSLLQKVLTPLGYQVAAFGPDATDEDLVGMGRGRKVGAIYVETPANPTNDVFDIAVAAGAARRLSGAGHPVWTIVDNTFLGPFGQQPLLHGADLVVYSATKYHGGHSDLVAGAIAGESGLVERIKTMRYRIGTTADPHTAWLLGRSLETYSLRVERQVSNASRLAEFLSGHRRVAKVGYLGLIGPGDPRRALLDRQCTSDGAMISFEVEGGREAAFRFLDSMVVIGHATSLGGNESIACHPATTTHSNVDQETRRRFGVTEGLIRLSVGVERAEDLIADLDQALSRI